MTSTDIAVASGFCDDIGNKERVKHIPEEVRTGSLKFIKKKIEAAIDRVKVKSLTFNIWNINIWDKSNLASLFFLIRKSMYNAHKTAEEGLELWSLKSCFSVNI